MSIRTKVLRELEAKPCSLNDLKNKLGNDRKVRQCVGELLAEGKVTVQRGLFSMAGPKKRERPAENLVCTIVKLSERFGFARRADGKGDVFIPGSKLLGAMPGDKVMVDLFEKPRVPGSMEGEVTSIVEEHNEFVGTVWLLDNGYLALEPDHCPDLLINIRKNGTNGVRPGDKAAVTIVKRGAHHDSHMADVTLRFGSGDSAAQCARAILYSYDISQPFPAPVAEEAAAIPQTPEETETARRLDLRDWPIFTIDSAETKDIDDAVSIEATDWGWRLGVHIADVSHYVRPGTALDDEAFRRATSVYYADRVVPMLPKELSNGACSLNPQEDRLAFSCLMELDKQGTVQSYRFAKTVIRSRVKGVYKEINALLEGTADEAVAARYAEVAAQFEPMQALYRKRLALRKARGGMELDSPEGKLILDEKGVCVDVQVRTRGVSECIIEEFMLLANECAANLGRTEKLPFVYRVHEQPSPEKASELVEMLAGCGIAARFKKPVPTQRELAAILESVQNSKLESAVNTAILRSMQKAVYEAEPKGHFGLALEDYAHFTSPIRRYPDLAIHRILSGWCEGEKAAALTAKYGTFAAEASRQSSEKELNAMQAERDAEDCYKAEYMLAHLGEQYVGRVSGVTAKGIFVMLENTVEGYLPAALLCKGEPVNGGVRLSDSLTGQSWMLGDPVAVTVARADVATGKVDFAPAETE